MEVTKTEIHKIINYLDDAAAIYESLARLRMQKCSCRAHMIKQLTHKLKSKLHSNDKK